MQPGSSIVVVGSTACIDPGPTMSIYGAITMAGLGIRDALSL